MCAANINCKSRMVGFKLALAHPRISGLFKFYPTFSKIWQTCCKKIKETELLEDLAANHSVCSCLELYVASLKCDGGEY